MHHAARRLLPVLLLAAASIPAALADTEPASPADASSAPATSTAKEPAKLDVVSSYVPGDFIGSIDDLKLLVEEVFKAKWDTTKAAKVEGLVIEHGAANWKLDGHVYLKQPVRGVASEAAFIGSGRFQLTPPVAIERQQVRRFLGSEAVDVPVKRVEFQFSDLAVQQLFEGLAYTEQEAVAAKSDEDVQEWLDEVGKPKPQEEVRGERFRSYFVAVSLYERLLKPHAEGSVFADTTIDVPKDQDKSRAYPIKLAYGFRADELEEETLNGQFDHGNSKPWSLITSFHRAKQYDGRHDYAATSDFIEKETKQEATIRTHVLRATVDPGAERDVVMSSRADVEFLKDGVKALYFSISPYLSTKAATVAGKEAGFLQPAIPGEAGLYTPAITVLLPRAYAKGEHVEIGLELQGHVLKDFDGFTYYIKDEDTWHPSLDPGFGGATKYDITLVVPEGFTAISSGADTACEGETPAGMTCFRFVTSKPIPAATFNVGKGLKADRGKAMDGTPVAVYTNTLSKVSFHWKPPGGMVRHKDFSLSKTGPIVLDKAIAALAVYEDWFGEFPFDRLALTPHPINVGRGFPSLVLLAQSAFMTEAAIDELYGVYKPPSWSTDAFITHEIAHQWWGGASGIRGTRDQWFSEGFANYGAVLCLELFDHSDGGHRMIGELKGWQERLAKDDYYLSNLSALALGTRAMSAENRAGYEGWGSYGTLIYEKGGFVMHMLRTLARAMKGDPAEGDVLFKKAMHDFFETYRGSAPSNLQLQQSLSKTYGTDLSWFFKQWVYGTGMPKLEFSHQVEAKPGGGYVLKGRIRQLDTQFAFPVSVVLHYGSGKSARQAHFYQIVKTADHVFEGPLDEKPDKVTINDELGLLCTWKPVSWAERTGS